MLLAMSVSAAHRCCLSHGGLALVSAERRRRTFACCTSTCPTQSTCLHTLRCCVQDAPPPGGFPSIRIDRRLPSTGPTGTAIFGIVAAVMGYGFYQLWSQKTDKRCAFGRFVSLRVHLATNHCHGSHLGTCSSARDTPTHAAGCKQMRCTRCAPLYTQSSRPSGTFGEAGWQGVEVVTRFTAC
jgi:hypothetical protein